ncbi:MAG: hypothetical protein ABW133_14180 [Polyangiaceae bacterium]
MPLRFAPRHATLALALVTSGCSGSQTDPCAPEPAVEHFTLRSPGGFDELALQGDRLFGPNIDVTRFDDTYRGNVRQLLVDLRIRENLIEGTVANARTELRVERFPDGFAVRGLFGGRIGQFLVQGDRFEGRMGGRAFVLQRSESDPLLFLSGTEAGQLTARGSTELTFPASFSSRPVEQQAAILAIFFGR